MEELHKKQRFIFIVQGEGRGHMTQAMALYDLLIQNGHTVCEVLIGKEHRNDIPAYFLAHFRTCSITPIASPGFVKDANNKAIKVYRTIWTNILRFRTYVQSLTVVHQLVRKHKPDTLINFYDFIGGLYMMLYNPKVRHICIGHQYLLQHPDFKFPEGILGSDKLLYFLNTKITAQRAQAKLALSFRAMKHYEPGNIRVVPPLIRKQVLALQPQKEPFILVYMVYEGFLSDLIDWHAKNTHIIIHVFTDKKDINDGQTFNQTLTVHKLNDTLFLNYMHRCAAYASTAGFESICEAMYLGKPVMMVPPEGHFEQMCNALDATLAGAGIVSKVFDLEKLLALTNTFDSKHSKTFKDWAALANQTILSELETH